MLMDSTNAQTGNEGGGQKIVEDLQNEVEALRVRLSEVERECDVQRNLKSAFQAQAVRFGNALKSCITSARKKGLDLWEEEQQSLESLLSELEGVELYDSPKDDQGDTSTPTLVALKAEAHRDGWLAKPAEVELHDQIGQGATADIYRAEWHGFDVAVKCLRPAGFMENKEAVDAFAREVAVLSKQRHPYILKLFGSCLDPPQHAWIITEYLSSGTLMEWLHGSKKREWKRVVPLPPLLQRLNVATEISIAMQYLHERQPVVMHRDLKPSNVFLDEHLHVRIADFSFSCYKGFKECYTGETGTFLYMAPEVMRHEHYDEKCDVYSFGVMLSEIVTGNPPYIEDYMTPVQIACGAAEGSLRPALPEDLEPPLRSLIMKAWDQIPTNRPPFSEITATLKAVTKHSLEQATAFVGDSASAAHHHAAGEHIHDFFSGLLDYLV